MIRSSRLALSHPPMRAAIPLLSLLTLASPLRAADATFHPIFNGRDLTGWDGHPGFWSVEKGVLTGQTSGLTVWNSFLIWRGGTLRDFDLKLRFRLLNGNSGVQYRSREIGRWTVAGYQAEIANEPAKAGFLYEERGRKFLALVGQSISVAPGGHINLVRSLGERADYLRWPYYRATEWNNYEIIGLGHYTAHYLNGFPTMELVDDENERAARSGCLALQLHAGLPMTVEFRDILLKNL